MERFSPPPLHPLDPISPLASDNITPFRASTPPSITTVPPRPPSPVLAPPIITTQIVSAPKNQQSHLPVKYDPAEQVFTLPDMEPLERGGPPPKKWAPVHRQVKTIGGGSWSAATWISEGEPAVPAKPPTGFIPGLVPSGTGFDTTGPIPANSLQGLNALSSLALGLSNSGTGLIGSATPTLGAIGGLAPAKRVRKMKSDASIGGNGGSGTSALAGGSTRKRTAGSAAKRTKKGTTGTAAPVIVEPPLVEVTRAASDTEMPDA